MANKNGCSLSSFERNKYFYSKLLTVRDFELEQNYGIEKNRLVNRLILGEGVVCGLEIQLDDEQREQDFLTVTLTAGVALDCCGREIVLGKTKSEPLEVKSAGTQYIYIEYKEYDKEPVSDLANGSSSESGDRYNRVAESYILTLSSEAPPEPESKPDLTAESLDELVRDYYDRSLKTCSRNQYDRLPLAVVEISETGQTTLKEEETQKIRPILPSNPLLYELLGHLYDSAVTGSKIDAHSFTSSDESITITPTEEPPGFDFTLTSETTEPSDRHGVFTGKRVLELATDEDLPQGSLQPVTVRIDDLQENEPFSVMLAPQLPATVPPVFTPTLGDPDGTGLHFVFGSHPELPRTYVAYVPQPYNQTFEIHGCDPNLSELDLKQVEVVYWVIAGAKEPSLKDRILELLANNPEGMGVGLIGRELKVDRPDLQTELANLIDEDLIRRNSGSNGKYFLVET